MTKEQLDKLHQNCNDIKTHATLESKTKKLGRPFGSINKSEQANVSLSVAFTPTQKKKLIAFAKKDDRTAGYVIKKLLIKAGIIEDNK